MLHYVYIKFRARYFHYVSMPTEILSQDFISEFHLLFQQRLLRFLMKLLVHRSFQWFPALIQLHFHRTNDTVLLNLITFSHHIIFLHCFFILKMLKYIQIVSISDSSREETYGNKQHTNFKWGGTEFHRVFLSDVFGDYIPSFHYPGRSAKQIFQTGSDWKEWWTLFNLSY